MVLHDILLILREYDTLQSNYPINPNQKKLVNHEGCFAQEEVEYGYSTIARGDTPDSTDEK